MKKRIRLKGRIRTYIQFTLYLGLLLLAIDAAVFMLDFRAGLLTFGFTIFYFAITLTLYFYNKPIIMNELISFATEYGQIQRKLLRDLELPYALLDDSGIKQTVTILSLACIIKAASPRVTHGTKTFGSRRIYFFLR